ncbi:MAG: bifunctional alpha/beta hydrolase/OsmC family protein [Candidatus Nanopelagicales bacterium]|jgi:putative redox protein|nr:bifunctional alpha/beta hydrolase/OsmC family protein [Candidatus Nanopelagicales bacterium]
MTAGDRSLPTGTRRMDFTSVQGHQLAGLLTLPEREPTALAVFAHCFTCGKDSHAAARIARALAERGYGVLRFDVTGLGESQGEFAGTTFSCDVADLVGAADLLRRTHRAPALLVGHSLGGAAVLAAAQRIPEVSAVVTIGAPSDPAHVAHLLVDSLDELERTGSAAVTLGTRTFTISRALVEDLREQPQEQRIAGLDRALLVLHAPRDLIVGIDNARRIYDTARHPKSFVALDGADHLLSDRADAAYAAEVIAAWASRYVSPATGEAAAASPAADEGPAPEGVVVRSAPTGRYTQDVTMGRHALTADEPTSVGGDDAGPDPYDLLLAALGACTSMTLRMYADRKGLPLAGVEVALEHRRVHASDCESCETAATGMVDHIARTITLSGEGLTQADTARLLEIADRCPVHRTLTGQVHIDTRLA